MHHPTDRIAHTTAFVTPVMEHWLEREIAQWVVVIRDKTMSVVYLKYIFIIFRLVLFGGFLLLLNFFVFFFGVGGRQLFIYYLI